MEPPQKLVLTMEMSLVVMFTAQFLLKTGLKGPSLLP